MTILYLLAAAYLLAAIVHMSYVYVMGLKFARDNGGIPYPVYVLAVPTIIVMIPFYVLLNLTLGTILFLEWPRSLQFTERCNRNIARGSGWRYKQALWWCRKFLDPFEAGGHCRGS